MKHLLNLFMILIVALNLVGCAALDSDCKPMKCKPNDNQSWCKQPIKKITYNGQEMGILTYLVSVIQTALKDTSKKIFEKITGDSSYKKVLAGSAILFIAIYGIAIALGLAQPSPYELASRVVKIGAIFYLLGTWDNFNNTVASFFEDLTSELTAAFASAIVNTAGGGGGDSITALDVFNFVDDKVLGVLLGPRFSIMMGGIMTASATGFMVGLLLLSVIMSYLWNVIMMIQIYIMSAIARALLYAIFPVFLVFLFFKQTQSLFEGWLKQLINFTLQPVFLVAFMALFNGIFFNYLDTMFSDDYEICYEKESTNGQVTTLTDFYIHKVGEAKGKPKDPIQLSEAMDMFTFFVIIMLGFIMVKMNTWAVQAASQLSEGAITFSNTMAGNNQFASKVTEGFGNQLRKAAGIGKGKG